MLKGVRTRLEDLNLVSTSSKLQGTGELTETSLGSEPNQRPPPEGASERRQGVAELEHHGEQDEGHLPHLELLQYGRHQEVSHRGVLGALQRHPHCPKSLG